MRFLIIGPSNRFQSGIGVYTEKIALGLAARGHRVGLILLDRIVPSFIYPGRSRINNSPKLDFEEDNVEVLGVMNYHSLSTRGIKRAVDAFDPHVSIIQWWTFAVFPMISRLTRLAYSLNGKVIFEMHEAIDQNDSRIPGVKRLSRSLSRGTLTKADGIIAHSTSDVALIKGHFGLTEMEFLKLPHLNYDQYGPLIDGDEAKSILGIEATRVILSFGLIRKYKGIMELIDIFNSMPNDDCALLIVGEIWDERAEISTSIGASPKRDSIILVDRYVDDDEVPVFFSAANVLALPYSRASQSGVGAIALHYGIPAISYAVGGLVESIGEYARGTLVPPGDKEGFVEAIVESLDCGMDEPSSENGNHGSTIGEVLNEMEAWLGELCGIEYKVGS